MKTTIGLVSALLILLGGVTQLSIAQTSPLTFGVRAGAGISFLRGSYYSWDLVDPEPLVNKFDGFSFHGGGLINISLKKNWSFQPELLYTYESAKETVQRINDNGTLDTLRNITSNYKNSVIRIPILFKWSTGEPKAGQFSILFGPSFGYILSMKESNEFDHTLNNQTSDEYDWTPIANHIQLGGEIGTEFRILDNLFIDARYHYNLSRYYSGIAYSNILFGVGYIF